MDLYTFGLLLGATGLGVMGFSGVARHVGGDGAHAGGASGAHAGQAQAHGLHVGREPHVAHMPGASLHGHAPGAAHGHLQHVPHLYHTLGWLVSPRVIFGILLGWGTAGLVLGNVLGSVPSFIAALAIGVAFERLVLNGVWNLALRFASRPALTLEAAVAGEATAVTAFDDSGHGIIQIEIDGQVVQVLGTLTRAERALGHRVRVGETLRVEEVDPSRNRCRVSIL